MEPNNLKKTDLDNYVAQFERLWEDYKLPKDWGGLSNKSMGQSIVYMSHPILAQQQWQKNPTHPTETQITHLCLMRHTMM